MTFALTVETTGLASSLPNSLRPAKRAATVLRWRRRLFGGGDSRGTLESGPDWALNGEARLRWEVEVLSRASEGEVAALGELYDAYAELVLVRVLLPKLGEAAAAEDALAETFQTGLARISQFEARGTSIYYWFARIATNKALDQHRRDGAQARGLVNIEQHWTPLLEAPLTPEDAALGKNDWLVLQGRLGECLGALSPRYRRALELRYLQELSREECAREMELRLGTFDVLLLRAVKALRKQWSKAVEQRGSV